VRLLNPVSLVALALVAPEPSAAPVPDPKGSGVSGGVQSGTVPGTGPECAAATLSTAPICSVGCISTFCPAWICSSGRIEDSVPIELALMLREGLAGGRSVNEVGAAKVEAGEAGMTGVVC
jgi:hypothetical protein